MTRTEPCSTLHEFVELVVPCQGLRAGAFEKNIVTQTSIAPPTSVHADARRCQLWLQGYTRLSHLFLGMSLQGRARVAFTYLLNPLP